MRASGMSATAIRRALGLSEMEAVACGLVVPASARPASSRLGAGDAPGHTTARVGGPGACQTKTNDARVGEAGARQTRTNGARVGGAGARQTRTNGARVGGAGARQTKTNDARVGGAGARQTRTNDARVGGAGAAGACMMYVVAAVARAGGLCPKDLIGRGRTRALTRARQLAMHLLHEIHPGVSLHAIGCLLDRDHTTVLYGCRRAEALLARGGAFRELYERARRELASPGRRTTEAGR
jgi:hypothetical protein